MIVTSPIGKICLKDFQPIFGASVDYGFHIDIKLFALTAQPCITTFISFTPVHGAWASSAGLDSLRLDGRRELRANRRCEDAFVEISAPAFSSPSSQAHYLHEQFFQVLRPLTLQNFTVREHLGQMLPGRFGYSHYYKLSTTLNHGDIEPW